MSFESTKVRLPDTGAYLCRLFQPLASRVPGLGLVFVIDGQIQAKLRGAAYSLGKADVLLLQHCEFMSLLPSNPVEDGSFLLILRIAPAFLSFAFGDTVPAFACGPIPSRGGGGVTPAPSWKFSPRLPITTGPMPFIFLREKTSSSYPGCSGSLMS
ncbi:MAG: hypothetical protein LBQ88_17840 [Treponema sp.]|nr:hypothetical protein [Treponema sp.]